VSVTEKRKRTVEEAGTSTPTSTASDVQASVSVVKLRSDLPRAPGRVGRDLDDEASPAPSERALLPSHHDQLTCRPAARSSTGDVSVVVPPSTSESPAAFSVR
jgi:hypothetical protein